MQTVTWPDTRFGEPHASAVWLLGRHQQLAQLAERAGVVSVEEDGDPDLDLDALAERVGALDADRAAWSEYERRRPAPPDDERYDAWEAAGPGRNPAAVPLAGMSRTEWVSAECRSWCSVHPVVAVNTAAARR